MITTSVDNRFDGDAQTYATYLAGQITVGTLLDIFRAVLTDHSDSLATTSRLQLAGSRALLALL
jgi:hypothetical protein